MRENAYDAVFRRHAMVTRVKSVVRTLNALALVGAAAGLAGCSHDRGRPAGGGHAPAGDAGSNTNLLAAAPKTPPLVPRPRVSEPSTWCERPFTIDASTRIAIEDGADERATAEQLAHFLGLGSAAIEVLPPGAKEPTPGIVLRRVNALGARDPAVTTPDNLEDEAFRLDVSTERAVVRARGRAGLFYGAQTIAQLAGARPIGEGSSPSLARAPANAVVPCMSLDDAPRLRFRAMHLDVARHFFPKEVVKRYIDLLAFYRFNVFHWHLTDDQGFRIEIKSHPELTAVAGKDGFYTQAEAREVIEYARARSITVVPEIEMPGHARAILAAHPELSCTGKQQEVPRTWGIFDDVLCAGNEKTYALLDDILGEIAPLFPSKLLHIGGDEVPTTRWSACPKCRATMKAHHVDLHDLEGHVMRRVVATLHKLGKRPVVWDEALEGLAASPETTDAVTLAWQSAARGREAAKRGFDVVMAPNDRVYFNFHQSHAKSEPGHASSQLPWPKVRTFDPHADVSAAESDRIIGGEGALWTEYVLSRDDIDTLLVPRIAALSETLWSGPAPSEDDFIARFNAQLPMLDASRIGYFVEPPTGAPARKVILEGETTTVTMAPSRLFAGAVVRWTRDGADPTPSSPVLEGPIPVGQTTTIAAATFLPNGRRSPVVRSEIIAERPRPAVTSAAPTDKGARFVYAEGPFHRLPDFSSVPVKARGRVSEPTLPALDASLGGKLRPERFAAQFEGLVDVKADGVHRFVVRADDGVRVEVDDVKLVEDDGEHEPRESSGEIALARGLHRVRIAYFQGTEGKELDVRLEGPSMPLGPLELVTERAAAKSSASKR